MEGRPRLWETHEVHEEMRLQLGLWSYLLSPLPTNNDNEQIMPFILTCPHTALRCLHLADYPHQPHLLPLNLDKAQQRHSKPTTCSKPNVDVATPRMTCTGKPHNNSNGPNFDVASPTSTSKAHGQCANPKDDLASTTSTWQAHRQQGKLNIDVASSPSMWQAQR